MTPYNKIATLRELLSFHKAHLSSGRSFYFKAAITIYASQLPIIVYGLTSSLEFHMYDSFYLSAAVGNHSSL